MMSCDCCGRLVRRLHGVRAYGLETWACDECIDYDAEAYGELEREREAEMEHWNEAEPE